MTRHNYRWFRFSLRTGFAVLAILCLAAAWISVQLRWIHDRHAFRARQLWSAESGHRLSKDEAAAIVSEGFPTAYHKHAPRMLGLFGEYGLEYLYISIANSEARRSGDEYSVSINHPEVRTAMRLFPEAEVRVYWFQKETGASHEVQIDP